jgi:hypothetical protein
MVGFDFAEAIMMFAGCLKEMELWYESEWSFRRGCVGKCGRPTLLQRRYGVTMKRYLRKCPILANQSRVDVNAVLVEPELAKRGS